MPDRSAANISFHSADKSRGKGENVTLGGIDEPHGWSAAPARRAGDTLAALVVLGLFGYWAIAVFAIGVWFLLWVVRICVIVWLGLAYLLRRACTGQ